MPDQEQVKRVKCPHCGWERSISIDVIEDESIATVTKGPGDLIKAAAEKIKAILSNSQIDAANAWVDMPPCPHCHNVYKYNVRTGETHR